MDKPASLSLQNGVVLPLVVLNEHINHGALARPEPHHAVRVINPRALIGEHLPQRHDKIVWDGW